MTQLVNNIDFPGLEKDPSIAQVSFGGAIMIPDDLTILIEECDRQQGTSFRTFRGAMAAQIWGDVDDDAAEFQAFVLREDAVRALAALSDDAIRRMLDRHEAEHVRFQTTQEKARRKVQLKEKVHREVVLHAYPLGLAIAIAISDAPLWQKLAAPVAGVALLWAIRLLYRRIFPGRKPKPRPEEPKAFDWMPRFRKWRRLLLAAADEGRAVVYLWSL